MVAGTVVFLVVAVTATVLGLVLALELVEAQVLAMVQVVAPMVGLEAQVARLAEVQDLVAGVLVLVEAEEPKYNYVKRSRKTIND
jgi:hypothetical protein